MAKIIVEIEVPDILIREFPDGCESSWDIDPVGRRYIFKADNDIKLAIAISCASAYKTQLIVDAKSKKKAGKATPMERISLARLAIKAATNGLVSEEEKQKLLEEAEFLLNKKD